MQARQFNTIPKRYSRIDYEIPERYRNAFYLANASFFDSTNWFMHRAYEVVFPTLKNTYRSTFKERDVGEEKVHQKLENVVEILDQCNSIIDVRFPIKRENGKLEIIRGFRAHYGETVNNSPCLGGIRIDENITRDHMKALCVLSSIKNFCLGIGLSGAHGGIKIDPKKYSDGELKNIVENYTTELFKKGYCGHMDIMHPDINTNEREMKWISETFAKCSGQSLNVSSVGKPAEYGGIDDFNKATALGAVRALKVFMDNPLVNQAGFLTQGIKDKRFIIQGLGKVGKHLGLMLVEAGATCVGVKENEAYLYDSKGIDLKELLIYREKKGSIENFGLSKTEYPDSIYTEDCDILVLAACHKSLVCYIAKDVKAKVILEAADGPITPTAHKILTTKSKLVIPDIYACAGANVVGYFEYLRNLQQIGISEENVLRCSKEMYANIYTSMQQHNRKQVAVCSNAQDIENIFAPLEVDFVKNSIDCVFSEVGQDIMFNLGKYRLGVDIRTAAYAVAIKNIFKAIFEKNKFI